MAVKITANPCEKEACGKDVGVVVKGTTLDRDNVAYNKRHWLFIAPLNKMKCGEGENARIVFKDTVFPNDYLVPTNLNGIDVDLGQQDKEQNTANNPMPTYIVTGYKAKIDFNSTWTYGGAWNDFLNRYSATLPMGDDAYVDALLVYDILEPKLDEVGKVIGGKGLKALHFTGPLDIDKFFATGSDEDLSNLKGTIKVNNRWEKVDLVPEEAGAFDNLIDTIYNVKGVTKVWDNNCPTKLLK